MQFESVIQGSTKRLFLNSLVKWQFSRDSDRNGTRQNQFVSNNKPLSMHSTNEGNVLE